MKWPKQDHQRIKLAASPEAVEYVGAKRKSRPPVAFGPIQDDGALLHQRQDLRHYVLVPYRAVLIHNQYVFSSWQPQDPDEHVQSDSVSNVQRQRNQRKRQDKRQEHYYERSLPKPSRERFLLPRH
jgi:hypothetical protein